jgi:hypothetical protein
MIEPPPRLAKRPTDGYVIPWNVLIGVGRARLSSVPALTIGEVTGGEFKWDANVLILIRCNFKPTEGGKLG